MDDRRFDTLTRILSEAPSRRGALTALLGGTLGLVGLAATDAKKKGKKGKGKKKKKKPSPPVVPPPPVAPPPPPPPACIAVQKTCTPGSCCDGRTCGDNFCAGDPPVCCGEVGAACTAACDCCGRASGCGPDNTCVCNGLVCNGVCTDGECCPGGNDCPVGQTCQDGTCVCTSGVPCDDTCCSAGEVCERSASPDTCLAGSCSDHDYDYCTSEEWFTCGERCDCITSVDPNVGVCTDDIRERTVTCFACTTNADCEDETGVTGAICVQGGANYCSHLCPETPAANFCVRPGCPAASPLTAASSLSAASSAGMGGKSASREAPAKTRETKQAAEDTSSARRGTKRSRGKRRR